MDKKKQRLRIISFLMLAAAVIFVLCALSAPNLGTAFYLGSFRIGAAVWRVCYAVYALVMATLLIASFLVKDNKNTTEE